MQINYRNELWKLLPENATIVECGSAEGYFSADILRWPNCGQLILVDTWARIPGQSGDGSSPQEWHDKNYNAAMQRIDFAKEKVKILRGLTWDMAAQVADESLDLLYLDACHTYECVMEDLNKWFPKVKKGGIIAGHDYKNRAYGVYPAVWNFTMGGRLYEVFDIPENKEEDAGFFFYKP